MNLFVDIKSSGKLDEEMWGEERRTRERWGKARDEIKFVSKR
jgi:hypothetical protein